MPAGTIVGRSTWSGGVVKYAGEVWFPVRLEDLWQMIEDFDRYREWWPWLHELTSDQPGLVAGNVLQATLVPPIPYRVKLQVWFDRCERLSVTEARIGGELRGRASLSFDEIEGGTRVRASWTLSPASRPMRVAARVAQPLMRWGHDRVVEWAVSGFGRATLKKRRS